MSAHQEETGPHIVVAGAGYAGLAATFELQGGGRRPRFRLTVVDRHDYHTFVTQLHTVAGGSEDEEDVTLPLGPLIQLPDRLLTGRLDAIDRGRQEVTVAGQTVRYDYLLLALGSEPEYFGVPGAQEHGYVIGTLEAALQARQRLRGLLAAQETVRVVVAGAGLTGVEVAGELADTYGSSLQIHLVEAAPEVMPGFPPALARGARRVLEAKKVRVHTGRPIARVAAGTVQLASPHHPAEAIRLVGTPGEVACDLLIWAGGVRGPALLAQAGLAVNRRGRALVDACQHAQGDDRVYVIGDAAAFMDPATGLEAPPTAQLAVQAGRAVARSLRARLRGQPEIPFAPRHRGFFASLGQGAAIGQIGGTLVQGLPAFGLKQLVDAHHAWETGGLAWLLRRGLRQITGRRGAPRPT